jgi:ABC-2 type transport system ATP-binding protein
MRMITGFIPPTEGKITVGGYDMIENPIPAKALIGYLPENAPAYSDMTVYGFLNFAAELRGLRGEDKKRAVNRVVEMCFLESVIHQSVDTLSKGYRHRTCFAQSIIHDPDILILDEPTDGLDPNQKHEVRTLIRQMGEKRRSFSQRTFWKRWTPFVRGRSSSIRVGSWRTARRHSCDINPTSRARC